MAEVFVGSPNLFGAELKVSEKLMDFNNISEEVDSCTKLYTILSQGNAVSSSMMNGISFCSKRIRTQQYQRK